MSYNDAFLIETVVSITTSNQDKSTMLFRKA